MRRGTNKLSLGVAFAALVGGLPLAAASAQGASVDQQIAISISAQPLSGALRQLAETSGLQLIYDAKITDGKSAPRVSGTMTSRAALTRLLDGSGLTFQLSGDRSVVIALAPGGKGDVPSGDGVISGGVVDVEGTTGNMPDGDLVSSVNGVNGSRDVEATEGSGSYTTGATSVATKIPLELRETPLSVSVVTRQQIEDQNLISAKDILERLPGITATPGSNGEEFSIYSRGFEVNTFTFDGGAPFTIGSGGAGNRPIIDISEFDSVQLVRGANGMFGGYGDPGGTVNLERKKPLDHRQITYDQDIGSFNYFREEVDATGPLTPSHRLRGRVVAARQDNDYFYDIAYSHKTSIYGSFEYDLTPSTLLTFGASYNRERNRPNQGGLPRYEDGTEIDFPVSTCLCLASDYDRAKKAEIFATLNHQFNSALSIKGNATYNDQRVSATYYGVSANVIKGGANSGTIGGYGSFNPNRQAAVDLTMTGGFDLLNRHHQFVIGGNYVHTNIDGGTNTFYPTLNVANIFQFDPYGYPVPPVKDPDTITLRGRTNQFAAYASTRLEIFSYLHVLLGLRYNYLKQTDTTKYSYSPDPQTSASLGRNLSKPMVGFTFDFAKRFTLYGNYENIYKPQVGLSSNINGPLPPPITGRNAEMGVKYASADKKFNMSVAYYSITQKGALQPDYTNPGSVIPYLNDTRSKGVDVEAAGELFPGLQISASYTYNKNALTRQAYPTGVSVVPATSFSPRNKAKFWVTYRPPGTGLWQRFVIGGGVDAQSSSFYTGSVCATTITDPSAYCPYTGPNSYIAYAFTTKGYTIISAKLGYLVNKNVDISIVGKNLTNVKEYIAFPYQNTQGYNFYTTPFNVMGSVHVRF